jgi:hypothetical protein
MADQPEVIVTSQTAPANSQLSADVGATSMYDPPLSPQQASAAAFASQLAEAVSGVTRSVVQTPGFPPVTIHTAGVSYTIPLNGGTPRATRR